MKYEGMVYCPSVEANIQAVNDDLFKQEFKRTSLLAGVLGAYGYVANQQQNPAVLAIIKHSFTTVPGVLWIVTAAVLFFYRLNKKSYNKIVNEIKERSNLRYARKAGNRRDVPMLFLQQRL